MNKKNNFPKIEGTITITSLGSGYFSSERKDEDIYIPSQLLNTAFNGDRVEVVLYPRIKGEKPSGEIVNIVSRKKTRFVGTVEKIKGNKFAFFSADDHKIHVSFFLPNISPEIKNGTKVLIEMTEWKDPKKNPIGKVLQVIGKKGDNDVEMESIVIEKGFSIEFPDNVKRESEIIKNGYKQVLNSELSQRKDFRNVFTLTIDPIDAKDFDDAISFKKIEKDLFEIGVHIADVGHWVKEKGSIDKEARKRGFSIYLVDRTIPMLPEILSNDICSLNPNEDKLTFSAIFNITSEGDLKNIRFEKTVINSNKRFVYEEAQDIIDGKKNGPHLEELKILMALARKLRKKRVEEGTMDFGYDEVSVDVDDKGNPTRIYVKEGVETQQLIEEFMVLANREAAFFVGGKNSKGLCLFRIHERPDKDSLDNLFLFLKKFGYDIKSSGSKITAKEINSLLRVVAGKDEEFIVKSVVIRSLPKAIYSVINKGHFAMALAHYAHFTSPIRRYADLLVHRALFSKLKGKHPNDNDRSFYKETAEALSNTEIDLASAERLSLALKQTEYMMKKVGEVRKGIISGITEWGIYIQDIETRAEGMIRLRSMKDDFYTLNKEDFSITGSRTKKKYSLGDKVKVKIIGGDLERKTLDFSFI